MFRYKGVTRDPRLPALLPADQMPDTRRGAGTFRGVDNFYSNLAYEVGRPPATLAAVFGIKVTQRIARYGWIPLGTGAPLVRGACASQIADCGWSQRERNWLTG